MTGIQLGFVAWTEKSEIENQKENLSFLYSLSDWRNQIGMREDRDRLEFAYELNERGRDVFN